MPHDERPRTRRAMPASRSSREELVEISVSPRRHKSVRIDGAPKTLAPPPPVADAAVSVSTSLTLDIYRLIDRAVEEGIAYGWMRAHKHTATPDPEYVKDELGRAVMGSLSEIVRWPEVT